MMLRALLTIGAVQVVTMLVLLVRTKSLAVMLGPDFVGVLAVIDKLLAVIAQTASLSLPFAAVRFLPGRWSEGPAQFRDLFTRMRNVLLGTAGIAAGGALCVSILEPSAFGVALAPYRDAVTVALFGLPALALIPFLQSAVAGRMQQYRAMLVGFLLAIVYAIAVAGAWLGGLVGYYSVIAVLGSALALVASRLVVQDIAVTTVAPATRRDGWGLPVQLWKFSGALLVLSFLLPYAALYVHYRVLSRHGAQMAGWLQAGIGISLAVRSVLGTAHGVFLTPNVNRGGEPSERMEWANHFQATFCLIAGLSVPALLLFPDIAVRALYSAEFTPGAAFVLLFVTTEVLYLVSGTYQALVIALDRLRFHVASNLVAQLLVVAIAYELVDRFGILGAGLACLAAPIFLYASTMLFLHRAYGLRMPRPVALRSTWLLLAVVATGLVGALLRDFTWQVILAKIAAYAIVAGGFGLLLSPHERTRIRETLDGWKARRA